MRILLFSLATILLISCSRHKKVEKKNDTITPTILNHKINSFLFLRKGMSYNEVISYLNNNSIKHSDLLTPYWSEELENSKKNANDNTPYYNRNYEILNSFSNAKYIKIYKFKIGDIYFDELRLYFINTIVFKLTYEKYYHDYILFRPTSILDKEILNSGSISPGIRDMADMYVGEVIDTNEKASNSLSLLNSALEKKYGKPNMKDKSNRSFVESPLGNEYHVFWGDKDSNTLSFKNITISLGNSTQWEQKIDNWDKLNPGYRINYRLHYYLDVDFTNPLLNEWIMKDKIKMKKQLIDRKKREDEINKQKEEKFLNGI